MGAASSASCCSRIWRVVPLLILVPALAKPRETWLPTLALGRA